ncbi:MAG: S66 peptidase family protein [Alphaproteobacteria bacterium]|nr:hypothetical protein [Alphaproteobacteria bacterium]|tara:strand:+ start:562 stop:1476 length:915 start_codon:yes stop_codon:yes gene_type:complete
MGRNIYRPIRDKKIGIFAPSSRIDQVRFNEGVELLHNFGFETVVSEQCYLELGQSAGSHEEKLDALHGLLSDNSVGMIMAAGGGNRVFHILNSINYDGYDLTDKFYCGYSDSTALLSSFYTKKSMYGIYGPMVQNLPNLTPEDLVYFIELISGNACDYDFEEHAVVLKQGTSTGHLIGGTLSMLPCLTGTDYLPKIDGHILYIEDCNEELSRIDRMLAHLKSALPFDRLGGLIIGQFKNLTDTGRPFGFSLEDIISEHIDVINGPVVINAPIGHGNRMKALPFGVKATLNANDKKPHLIFNLEN